MKIFVNLFSSSCVLFFVNTNISEPAVNGNACQTLEPYPVSTPISSEAVAAQDGNRALQLPNAVADFERSEIRHANGNRFDLSVRESQLLQFLASNPGRPISRDEILRCVWHLNPRRLITRTIDMHIAHLRDKLQEDPNHPRVLVTVRGEGYMFAAAS